ncbi:MAG: class I SAM-dependent methyltransferase [Eubacteriales bacterium]|nr:class I SAM-dependent methyltransferase [Eubacteriales bacterium]
MERYIQSNKEAWSKLAKDHFNAFRKAFREETHALNEIIRREIGDIAGKEILHLQCNTGAGSIALSNLGAQRVTGVDLVPENIEVARELAKEFAKGKVEFIVSDIMKLHETHNKQYDMVFTSEGVLGWLPDLDRWAKTIRACLKEDGCLYVFDSHPVFLMFDEGRLSKDEYEIRYPYFGREPDMEETMGDYVEGGRTHTGVRAYFWMHTISDIINALVRAGLHIEFFNEFPEQFWDSGDMQRCEMEGLYRYAHNADKYPMSFSLKATVYPGR